MVRFAWSALSTLVSLHCQYHLGKEGMSLMTSVITSMGASMSVIPLNTMRLALPLGELYTFTPSESFFSVH